MSKAYYGSKISPHIIRSNEGFLICLAVPIARTGVQEYLAREIGIPERGNDVVKVYRLEEEVFSSKVLSSFEGKPFTEEHPNDWVTPESVEGLIKGVVTNVRRGSGESSDLLLADIIVYSKQQIEEIENKMKREVSCGYECTYVQYKNGYKQTNIVGNHVALVSSGRAGSRVAIKDTNILGGEATSPENNLERSKNVMSYKIPRHAKVSDFVKAVGLKTLAQDAEPEDIEEMVDELTKERFEAEADAEPIFVEADPDDSGEQIEQIKEEINEVRDAIFAILNRDSDEDEYEDFVEDEDPDEGLESLDALEEELIEDEDFEEELVEDDDLLEQVESVESDSDEDFEEMTNDSILELARVMKPIIASIPNVRQRRKVSDNLADVLKKHAKKAKDEKTTSSKYAKMISRSKDSSLEKVEDVGLKIAQAHNPHYKKEVK